MSEEEMKQRVQELQAYKLMPQGGIRTKLLLARGERRFLFWKMARDLMC